MAWVPWRLVSAALLVFGLQVACSKRPEQTADGRDDDAGADPAAAEDAAGAAPGGDGPATPGAGSGKAVDAGASGAPVEAAAADASGPAKGGGEGDESPVRSSSGTLAGRTFVGGEVVEVAEVSSLGRLRALPAADGGAVVVWVSAGMFEEPGDAPGTVPDRVLAQRLDRDGRRSGEAVELLTSAKAADRIEALAVEPGPSGGVVVAWLGVRDGFLHLTESRTQVWFERFGPDLASGGAAVPAVAEGFLATAEDGLQAPGVGMDASGRVLLLWDRRGGGGPAAWELVAGRFDAEGRAAAGVEQLGGSAYYAAPSPRQLALLPAGGGIALYAVDGRHVGRRFGADFAWSGAARPLLEENAWARLALSADGSFLLVWRTQVAREEDPRVRERIWVRGYDAEARPLGEPRLLVAALDLAAVQSLLDPATEPRVFFPSLDVAALPGGGYVVGWVAGVAVAREQEPSRGLGVWAQPCLSDGSPAGGRWAVVEGSRRFRRYDGLTLAVGGDGGVFVVWQEGPQLDPRPIAVRVFRPVETGPGVSASRGS